MTQAPAINGGYRHREAFCLMWYRCSSCRHTERIWNSRDGVTPFGMGCPSCGKTTLFHIRFDEDTRAINHRPHPGQRIWINMSYDRSVEIACNQAARIKERGGAVTAQDLQFLIEGIYHGGGAPDIAIHGYERTKT